MTYLHIWQETCGFYLSKVIINKIDRVLMEESKNEKEVINKAENESEESELTSPATQVEEKTENISEKLKKLEEENAGLSDQNLRLTADFENFRKRIQKERIRLISTAQVGLVTKLLPILDDFERALAALEESDNTDTIDKGNETDL